MWRPRPVSSCETLLGLREFPAYFREQAVECAIIDYAVERGVWQSMKIAANPGSASPMFRPLTAR
jgi:hypothetical protein